MHVHGNPLLLLDIVRRKFVILGQVFWPQDMILSAITVLIFLTGIIVFTAAFGRHWCGWTCPQTVLMEMVFRKIEYGLEGDAAAFGGLQETFEEGRAILFGIEAELLAQVGMADDLEEAGLGSHG